MPNGNQPTGPEVEALVRRSELLAAKVASLEQKGFSREEAMQILSADIKAGLTEFGTLPASPLGGRPGSPAQPPTPTPQPLDLSTVLGDWNITPSPLQENCDTPGLTRFSLNAVSVGISFVGTGSSRAALLFTDASGSGTRAEGSIASTGNSEFEFFGEFDVSRVRLRLTGNAGNTLEVVFRFEYRGTQFDLPFGIGCDPRSYPRTLVRN